jgi:gliding motility-associated-like protein
VGTDTVSWSNDICFNFEPILYIPNAFTPNDDDLNDQFILSGGALKTIDFKIFNRWGELLFQSDNLKTFWNGKYKDKLQPQGVYMYSCTYTDFRGKLYSTKGTITLLK